MSSSNYFYEYVNLLERVFSFAYENFYSYGMVERNISYSSFFQELERSNLEKSPIIEEERLIKSIFNEENFDLMKIRSYKECMWIAESYMRIQQQTRLTFEAIFLYIPIKKMYEYYQLFHEMDFSQIVDEFSSLYEKESALSLLLSRFDYSVKYVSRKTGIPYDSLFSYKQRRRDIKKINADSACLLSSILKVRVETLLELKM